MRRVAVSSAAVLAMTTCIVYVDEPEVDVHLDAELCTAIVAELPDAGACDAGAQCTSARCLCERCTPL